MNKLLATAALLALASLPVVSAEPFDIGCSGASCAGTADLSFSAVTMNTDGTPVTPTGYNLYHAADPADLKNYAAGGTHVLEVTSGLSQVVRLAPGPHAFAWTAVRCDPDEVSNNCKESELSAVLTKTIAPLPPVVEPPPSSPTSLRLTVAPAPGVNVAPVFKLTSTGKRSAEVAGFIPLGQPCTGKVLFTYRGQSYRKVDAAKVQFWGVTPGASLAAPCG